MFHKYTHLILTIVTAGTVSRCAFCASKHIQAPLSTSTLRVSRDIFAFTNSNIIVIEFFLPGIIHLCISIRPTTFKKRKKKLKWVKAYFRPKNSFSKICVNSGTSSGCWICMAKFTISLIIFADYLSRKESGMAIQGLLRKSAI